MNLESIRNHKSRTILQFSIPAIIAMIMTAMITIADGFFTGRYVGEEGIAAINLGLPIVYLYLGLGLMISVGGSALASIALGAGEKDKAENIFNQTMVTTVLISFTVSLVAFVIFQPLMNAIHMSEAVATCFFDYYMIMLLELPVMVINNAFGMFIRGEGNPQFFMKNSMLNVLANIVLDYLFAGRLNMGIQGIAVASLLSSIICLMLIVHYFRNQSVVYKFQKFVFEKVVLKNTVFNGFSEFIGEISMSITMFGYNLVIMERIGINGVAAFTVVGYLSYVFSMIVIGFGQGISPLVGFAFGARDKELAKKIRRKTNIYVSGTGAFVLVVMSLLSGWYSTVFVHSEIVRQMIQSGMSIFMLSFLFSGINTIAAFYFTSIGRAKEAAIISVLRGLVVLLICIFTLPILFGMSGVWMVAPITEAITIVFSVGFLMKNDKIEN